MYNIVFLDRDTLAPQVRLRRPAFAHDYAEYPRTRPEQVVERLAGASIAITNKVRLGADVLEQLPDLELVAVTATGSDCIDKTACKRLGMRCATSAAYGQHRAGTHLRADPGPTPQHRRLPRRRARRSHRGQPRHDRDPNVILTPHVAWASDEAQQALADQLIDNIEAFVAERPRNLL